MAAAEFFQTLVYSRDHPSSEMRRSIATDNIDKLLKSLGEIVHRGDEEFRPTTQYDAEVYETIEDLLREAYVKTDDLPQSV